MDTTARMAEGETNSGEKGKAGLESVGEENESKLIFKGETHLRRSNRIKTAKQFEEIGGRVVYFESCLVVQEVNQPLSTLHGASYFSFQKRRQKWDIIFINPERR